MGAPLGILTIEDVIEELIQGEIVDETDRYVDNLGLQRVNAALMVPLIFCFNVALVGRMAVLLIPSLVLRCDAGSMSGCYISMVQPATLI